jgi:hypothetical protein
MRCSGGNAADTGLGGFGEISCSYDAPMSRAPESVYLKLARAQEHLRAINVAIDKFREVDAYTITFEPNSDRRQVAIKLVILRNLPPEWAIIIGDCIHNLRGALDHLAFALPRATGTDPRWEDWSQFPICDAPRGFGNVIGRCLCGVDALAIEGVERSQPYFGRDGPEGHGLWYLRNLSNLDKHRLSPVVWSLPASGSVEIPDPPTGTARIVFRTGTPEHGDTIAKVYFSDPAPAGIEVTLNLLFGVTIRDIAPSGEQVGVNLVLERVYERVINAVCALEQFLA